MCEDEKWEGIPLRDNEQQWRGCEIAVHGCFATRGAKKNVCVRNEQQNHEVPKIGDSVKVSPPL